MRHHAHGTSVVIWSLVGAFLDALPWIAALRRLMHRTTLFNAVCAHHRQ